MRWTLGRRSAVGVILAMLSGALGADVSAAAPLVDASAAPRDVRAGAWQDDVSAFIRARMSERKSAGLSIAVATDELLWTQGFGAAHLSPKKRASAKTSYRMASVTKMWTATAIMQLAERGLVNLDAPVQRYLPNFPHRGAGITIRRLLGHLSGIPHYRDKSGPEGHIQVPMTTAQSLAIFKDWSLVARPGDRFVYTSYGYNVLGAVIEAVTRSSYGAYLKRRIWSRAGMRHTAMAVQAQRPTSQASGYRLSGGHIVPSDVVDISSRFAGGGTISTVGDMARYGRAMIAGRLLSPHAFQQMQMSMANADGVLTDYGMGMATYPLQGRPVIAHSGSQPETSTLLLMYPADNVVVALASNLEDQSDLLYAIAGFVGEQLLTGGQKRRPPAGSNLSTAVVARALGTTFGYGVAAHRRGHDFDDEGAAPLIEGFRALRMYLAAETPTDTDAIEGLRTRLGPLQDFAFPRVGAHMAGVLASENGEGALLPYHLSGPLPFFRDYITACERRDCPAPFRFTADEQERLLRWASGWDAAYSDEVRTFQVDAKTPFVEAQRVLDTHLTDARLKPSFVADLMSRYDAAIRGKDIEAAGQWAELAYRHYPQDPKVHIAWAEVQAERRVADAVTVAGAQALIGGEKRLSVGRLKYRALTLRKQGLAYASLANLKGASVVHPGVAHVWDSLSRQQERLGDLAAAFVSAETALKTKKSARRRARVTALRKRLPG